MGKLRGIENQTVSFWFANQWFATRYPLVFDAPGIGLRVANQWIAHRRALPGASKTSGWRNEDQQNRFLSLMMMQKSYIEMAE